MLCLAFSFLLWPLIQNCLLLLIALLPPSAHQSQPEPPVTLRTSSNPSYADSVRYGIDGLPIADPSPFPHTVLHFDESLPPLHPPPLWLEAWMNLLRFASLLTYGVKSSPWPLLSQRLNLTVSMLRGRLNTLNWKIGGCFLGLLLFLTKIMFESIDLGL